MSIFKKVKDVCTDIYNDVVSTAQSVAGQSLDQVVDSLFNAICDGHDTSVFLSTLTSTFSLASATIARLLMMKAVASSDKAVDAAPKLEKVLVWIMSNLNVSTSDLLAILNDISSDPLKKAALNVIITKRGVNDILSAIKAINDANSCNTWLGLILACGAGVTETGIFGIIDENNWSDFFDIFVGFLRKKAENTAGKLAVWVIQATSKYTITWLDSLNNILDIRQSQDVLTYLFDHCSGIDSERMNLVISWVLIPFSVTNIKLPLGAINALTSETRQKLWLGAILACNFFADLQSLYRSLLTTVIQENWTGLFKLVLQVLRDKGVTPVTIVSLAMDILISQSGRNSTNFRMFMTPVPVLNVNQDFINSWLDLLNEVFHLERDVQLLAVILGNIGATATNVMICWMARTASYLKFILEACNLVSSQPIREAGITTLVQSDSFTADPTMIARAIQIIVRENLMNIFGLFVKIVNDAGTSIGEIVRLVLGYAGTEAETWLDRIDEAVSLRTDDRIKEIVQILSNISGNLLEIFISWLLRVSSEAQDAFKKCIAILLAIPQSLRTANDDIEALFTRIFRTIIGWLRDRIDQLRWFMEQLFTWLDETRNDAAKVFAGVPGMLSSLSDLEQIKNCYQVPFPLFLASKAFMAAVPNPLTNPSKWGVLINIFIDVAFSRPPFEDVLVTLARLPGFAIWMLPFLFMFAARTKMKFIDWIGRDIQDLQSDLGMKVKELDEPSDGDGDPNKIRRYMIFSDTHRDWPQDDVVIPQLFDITNFRKTEEVYRKALLYCDQNHYTVIENGDCEDLWYSSSIFSPSTMNRAQGILNTYDSHDDPNSIYAILRRLQSDPDHCRYFRTQGNHDSFWHEGGDDARILIKSKFSSSFEIYDALIIPKVKTMDETFLGTLGDIIDKAGKPWQMDPATYLDHLLSGSIDKLPFGLSADRYNDFAPLFIFHGHQVDFWNCDEHNYLGKVLTTSFGVPADGIDALPNYLRGIDRDGNPLIKFGEIMNGLSTMNYSLWDNWPNQDVAHRLAREIEQQREQTRHLRDSLSFSETLAASLSLLLGYKSSSPLPFEFLFPWPKIQVVCGHTHYPQSRPYLPMELVNLAPDMLQPFVRSYKVPYYNTGVASWWEGIVWAIEVTEKGQPRLVYWDKYSDKPIPMAWELSGDSAQLSDTIKNHLQMLRNVLSAAGSSGAATLQSNMTAAFQTGMLSELTQTNLPASIDISEADIENRLGSLGTAIMGMLMPLLFKNDLKPFEFSLDLDKLPRSVGGSGVLPLPFEVPDFPMRRLAKVWLDYIGITDTGDQWCKIDGDLFKKIAGVCMLLSYTYGKGSLNAVGMFISVCAEVLEDLASDGRPFNIEVRWNRHDCRLSFRGTLSFEPELKKLFETAADTIPDFVQGLLSAAGNSEQVIKDLLLAPEHLFSNNASDSQKLFEIILHATLQWAQIGSSQAGTAGRGIASWLREGMRTGRPTLQLENPLLPDALRSQNASEIAHALWLLAKTLGAMIGTADCPDDLVKSLFGHIRLNKQQVMNFMKALDSDDIRQRASKWLADHWDSVKSAFDEAADFIKEIIDRLSGLAKEGPVIRQLLDLFTKAKDLSTQTTNFIDPGQLLEELKTVEEIAEGGASELWKKTYAEARRHGVAMKDLFETAITKSSSFGKWSAAMREKVEALARVLYSDFNACENFTQQVLDCILAFREQLLDFLFLGGCSIDLPWIIDASWMPDNFITECVNLTFSVHFSRLVLPGPKGGSIEVVPSDIPLDLKITIPFDATNYPQFLGLTVQVSHLPEFHVLDGRYRLPYGNTMGYQVADIDGDGSVEEWEIECVRQATGSSSYQYKLDCNKDGQVSVEDLALAHQQRDLYVNGLMYRRTTAPLGILIGFTPAWALNDTTVWFFTGFTSLHEESIPNHLNRDGLLCVTQGHFQLASNSIATDDPNYLALAPFTRKIIDLLLTNWIHIHAENRYFVDGLLYDIPGPVSAVLPSIMQHDACVLRLGHEGKDLQAYAATDLPSLLTRTFTFSATIYLKLLVTGIWAVEVGETGAGVAARPAIRVKMTYACGSPLAQVIGEWADRFDGIFENPNMVRRVLEESMLLRMTRSISMVVGPMEEIAFGWLDDENILKGLIEYLRVRGDGYIPGRTWNSFGDEITSWSTAEISSAAVTTLRSIVEQYLLELAVTPDQPIWAPKAALARLLVGIDNASNIQGAVKEALIVKINDYFNQNENFVAGFNQVMNTMLIGAPVEIDWRRWDLSDTASDPVLTLGLPGGTPVTFSLIDPSVLAWSSLSHDKPSLKKPLFGTILQVKAINLYTAPLFDDSLMVLTLPEGTCVTVESSFAFVEKPAVADAPRPFWLFVRCGFGTYGWIRGGSDFALLRNPDQNGALDFELLHPETSSVPDEINILAMNPSPPNTIDHSPWVFPVYEAIEHARDDDGRENIRLLYELIIGELKLEMFGPRGMLDASEKHVYAVLAHLNPVERGAFWIQKTADLKSIYYSVRLLKILGEDVILPMMANQPPNLAPIVIPTVEWSKRNRRDEITYDLDCAGNALFETLVLLIQSAFMMIPTLMHAVDKTTDGWSQRERRAVWKREKQEEAMKDAIPLQMTDANIVAMGMKSVAFIAHDVLSKISTAMAEAFCPVSRLDITAETVDEYKEPKMSDTSIKGFGYPVDRYEQRRAWQEANRDSSFDIELCGKIGSDTISVEVSLEADGGAGVGDALSNAGSGASLTGGGKLKLIPILPVPVDIIFCRGLDSIGIYLRFMLRTLWHTCNAFDIAAKIKEDSSDETQQPGLDPASIAFGIFSGLAPVMALGDIATDHPGFTAQVLEKLYIGLTFDFNVTLTGIFGADMDISETATPVVWIHFGGLVAALLEMAASPNPPSDADVADRIVPHLRFTLSDRTMGTAGTVPVSFEVVSKGDLFEAEVALPQGSELRAVVGGWLRNLGEKFRQLRDGLLPGKTYTAGFRAVIETLDEKMSSHILSGPPEDPDAANSPAPNVSGFIGMLTRTDTQESSAGSENAQVQAAKKALADAIICGVDAAPGRILDADPMADLFRISVFLKDEEWQKMVMQNGFRTPVIPRENIQDLTWNLSMPSKPDVIAWQNDPFAHLHGIAAGFDLYENADHFAHGRNYDWVAEGQAGTIWTQNGRYWVWIETKMVDILAAAGVAVPEIRFRNQELRLAFFRVNSFSFDFDKIEMLRGVQPTVKDIIHRVVLVTSGTRSDYLLLEQVIRLNRAGQPSTQDDGEEGQWQYPSS